MIVLQTKQLVIALKKSGVPINVVQHNKTHFIMAQEHFFGTLNFKF